MQEDRQEGATDGVDPSSEKKKKKKVRLPCLSVALDHAQQHCVHLLAVFRRGVALVRPCICT